MMTYESLIFDIDGTLWDSRALVAKGYNREIEAAGYPEACVNVEQLAGLFGKTTVEIADLLFPFLEKEARYALIARCMEAEDEILHADPCRVGYAGVAETLEKLAKTHRLFIVSNSECGYPELCMDKLGIGHLFRGHLCYGDTHTRKGLTIRRLMAEHGIENAAYIGATQGDLEAAEEAGIPFIFAAYGFGHPDHYDAKIEQFPDLLDLIEAACAV